MKNKADFVCPACGAEYDVRQRLDTHMTGHKADEAGAGAGKSSGQREPVGSGTARPTR